MKTAALKIAQLHRNPHLMDSPRDVRPVRHESRLSSRRGRRRRQA